MKPSYIYNVKAMLGALVLAGIMAGCADNEIVEITPADDSSQRQEPYVPESDDISRALAAIEGISDVTVDRETYGNRKAYYFFVEMPVSHREETGQTFRLRCALEYEGAEAPVVFYTSGYDVGNNTNQLDPNEMKGFLKANMLHMEHRYFGDFLFCYMQRYHVDKGEADRVLNNYINGKLVGHMARRVGIENWPRETILKWLDYYFSDKQMDKIVIDAHQTWMRHIEGSIKEYASDRIELINNKRISGHEQND